MLQDSILWSVGLLQERVLILTVVEIWEPSAARRMAEQLEAVIQPTSASKHERRNCDLGRAETGIYVMLLKRPDSLSFVERET